MDDWAKVSSVHVDYVNDTQNRNHPGAQSVPEIIYTNTTGRNDFHTLKIARDKQNIYFYAETVDQITPISGDNWMRLYIDTDRNPKTGWYGYDYRVIEGSKLQLFADDIWVDANKNIHFNIENNQLSITIPRKSLKNLSDSIDLEFKWSDNMQAEDPLDWYINGDTAPGGRFNCIYKE